MNTAVLELLASRICHDLISPVGAIHNGVEFIEEMGPDAGEDAMALIAHSAAQAAARLQIFRLAYGAGGADPHIKPENVHEAFAAYIAGDGKITQNWDPHGDLGFGGGGAVLADYPPGYSKILTGLLMLAVETLPKGGTITVAPGGELKTTITATGENVTLRDYTEEALSTLLPPQDLDPRLIHPYLVGMAAQKHTLAVGIEAESSDRVVFTIAAS